MMAAGRLNGEHDDNMQAPCRLLGARGLDRHHRVKRALEARGIQAIRSGEMSSIAYYVRPTSRPRVPRRDLAYARRLAQAAGHSAWDEPGQADDRPRRPGEAR